jgi:hypothetical protein
MWPFIHKNTEKKTEALCGESLSTKIETSKLGSTVKPWQVFFPLCIELPLPPALRASQCQFAAA